jgi:hypothetical protein
MDEEIDTAGTYTTHAEHTDGYGARGTAVC